MRPVSAALTTLLLLAGAVPAAAQFTAPQAQTGPESHVAEVGFRWWKPTPQIVIDTDALDDVGGAVDFVREFEVENDRFREFRATLKPGDRHKIRVGYVPVSYEETNFLVRTITFQGRTFDVGTEATGIVDWTFWRFGYEYDLVSGPAGFLGVIADARYNDVTASVRSGFGSAIVEDQVWVPTIGGIARGYLTDEFSVTGEFSGFSLTRDASFGEFYDLDLYGTLNLGDNFGVDVGYRKMQAAYRADADEGDVELDGIYFGIALRF